METTLRTDPRSHRFAHYEISCVVVVVLMHHLLPEDDYNFTT